MQVAEHMTFDPVAMEYYPTIFFNDFWVLRDHLIPVNETVKVVPLHLSLSTISLWKFTLFSQMDQAFSKQVCLGCHIRILVSRLFLGGTQALSFL